MAVKIFITDRVYADTLQYEVSFRGIWPSYFLNLNTLLTYFRNSSEEEQYAWDVLCKKDGITACNRRKVTMCY